MDERTRALERLYRDRYVAFRNTLATVTGSYDSARDVVQETFVRALEAWVWRIAFRTALEQRPRHAEPVANGSLDPSLPEPERDPELAGAVRRLPPRKRLVVFLHYFADLSYAEIAVALGISEGTVAATLSQARAALAETLDPKEPADDRHRRTPFPGCGRQARRLELGRGTSPRAARTDASRDASRCDGSCCSRRRSARVRTPRADHRLLHRRPCSRAGAP
jgi:RNA polymerase sigma-70 factor (ECF subfamily)